VCFESGRVRFRIVNWSDSLLNPYDIQEEFEDTKGRQSESVYRRRTENTMDKRKRTKGQTTIYKAYI
jgi:hypothetical protein